MTDAKTLKVTANGDREVVITRAFDAPRKLVFDALTKPELIRRWLLGPPGWEMPVCRFDAKVGGAYRFEWAKEKTGDRMGLGGIVREIVPGERLVATEKFDEAWYPGGAVVTYALSEKGGRTTLTMTILYDSREARDAVMRSPMESGVAASYDRLEEILASAPVR
jgi:uncharacterized protein YndB with AHSA1/START domain